MMKSILLDTKITINTKYRFENIHNDQIHSFSVNSDEKNIDSEEIKLLDTKIVFTVKHPFENY